MLARRAMVFFFHWFFLARATDSAEKDGLLLVFDILFWLSVGQLVGQSVCRSVFRSASQSVGQALNHSVS